MRIRLYDVTRITRTGLVPHSAIDAEDGAITAVYDTLPAEEPGVRSVDAKGAYAAPGFIDIHLHGGGGVEFMDATPERIRAGCAAHARHGTTTLLPTVTGLPAVPWTTQLSWILEPSPIRMGVSSPRRTAPYHSVT